MPESKVPMVEVRPRVERQILRVPQRKGYVRRLVLDDPARIEEMEELGYKVVQDQNGGPLKRREYIVMEIPADIYEARQAEKAERIRQDREARLNSAARRELSTQAETVPRGRAKVIGGVELEQL